MLGGRVVGTNAKTSYTAAYKTNEDVRQIGLNSKPETCAEPASSSLETEAEIFEISVNTLRMFDTAVQEFKNGYVSKPIQIF